MRTEFTPVGYTKNYTFDITSKENNTAAFSKIAQDYLKTHDIQANEKSIKIHVRDISTDTITYADSDNVVYTIKLTADRVLPKPPELLTRFKPKKEETSFSSKLKEAPAQLSNFFGKIRDQFETIDRICSFFPSLFGKEFRHDLDLLSEVCGAPPVDGISIHDSLSYIEKLMERDTRRFSDKALRKNIHQAKGYAKKFKQLRSRFNFTKKSEVVKGIREDLKKLEGEEKVLLPIGYVEGGKVVEMLLEISKDGENYKLALLSASKEMYHHFESDSQKQHVIKVIENVEPNKLFGRIDLFVDLQTSPSWFQKKEASFQSVLENNLLFDEANISFKEIKGHSRGEAYAGRLEDVLYYVKSHTEKNESKEFDLASRLNLFIDICDRNKSKLHKQKFRTLVRTTALKLAKEIEENQNIWANNDEQMNLEMEAIGKKIESILKNVEETLPRTTNLFNSAMSNFVGTITSQSVNTPKLSKVEQKLSPTKASARFANIDKTNIIGSITEWKRECQELNNQKRGDEAGKEVMRVIRQMPNINDSNFWDSLDEKDAQEILDAMLLFSESLYQVLPLKSERGRALAMSAVNFYAIKAYMKIINRTPDSIKFSDNEPHEVIVFCEKALVQLNAQKSRSLPKEDLQWIESFFEYEKTYTMKTEDKKRLINKGNPLTPKKLEEFRKKNQKLDEVPFIKMNKIFHLMSGCSSATEYANPQEGVFYGYSISHGNTYKSNKYSDLPGEHRPHLFSSGKMRVLWASSLKKEHRYETTPPYVYDINKIHKDLDVKNRTKGGKLFDPSSDDLASKLNLGKEFSTEEVNDLVYLKADYKSPAGIPVMTLTTFLNNPKFFDIPSTRALFERNLLVTNLFNNISVDKTSLFLHEQLDHLTKAIELASVQDQISRTAFLCYIAKEILNQIEDSTLSVKDKESLKKQLKPSDKLNDLLIDCGKKLVGKRGKDSIKEQEKAIPYILTILRREPKDSPLFTLENRALIIALHAQLKGFYIDRNNLDYDRVDESTTIAYETLDWIKTAENKKDFVHAVIRNLNVGVPEDLDWNTEGIPICQAEKDGKIYRFNLETGDLSINGTRETLLSHSLKTNKNLRALFGKEMDKTWVLHHTNDPHLFIYENDNFPDSRLIAARDSSNLVIQKRVGREWLTLVDLTENKIPPRIQLLTENRFCWMNEKRTKIEVYNSIKNNPYAVISLKKSKENDSLTIKDVRINQNTQLLSPTETKIASVSLIEDTDFIQVYGKRNRPKKIEFPRLKLARNGLSLSYDVKKKGLVCKLFPKHILAPLGKRPGKKRGFNGITPLPSTFEGFHMLEKGTDQKVIIPLKRFVETHNSRGEVLNQPKRASEDKLETTLAYTFDVNPETNRLETDNSAAYSYLAYVCLTHQDYEAASFYLEKAVTSSNYGDDYAKVFQLAEQWIDSSPNGSAIKLKMLLLKEKATLDTNKNLMVELHESANKEFLTTAETEQYMQIISNMEKKVETLGTQAITPLKKEVPITSETKEVCNKIWGAAGSIAHPGCSILENPKVLISHFGYYYNQVFKIDGPELQQLYQEIRSAYDIAKELAVENDPTPDFVLESQTFLLKLIHLKMSKKSKTLDLLNQFFPELPGLQIKRKMQIALIEIKNKIKKEEISKKDLDDYFKNEGQFNLGKSQLYVQYINQTEAEILGETYNEVKNILDDLKDIKFEIKENVPDKTTLKKEISTYTAQTKSLEENINSVEAKLKPVRESIAPEISIKPTRVIGIAKPLTMLFEIKKEGISNVKRQVFDDFKSKEKCFKRVAEDHEKDLETYAQDANYVALTKKNATEILEKIKDNCQKLEKEIDEIQIELLDLQTTSALTKMQRLVGKKKKTSLDDLINRWRRNEYSSNQKLDKLITKYMEKSIQAKYMDRVITNAEEYIASCGKNKEGDPNDAKTLFNLLKAERHFEVETDPNSICRDLLFIEFSQKIVLRKSQVETIEKMMKDPNAVTQLGMGGGKSKVLLPLLAKQKANGSNLVTLILPEELYETNCRDLDATNRHLFEQEMYRFEFSRNSDRSIPGLNKMYKHLLDTIDNEGYIMTTKRSMLSLRNTFQELTNSLDDKDTNKTLTIEQLKIVSKMLKLFRDRGDVIADEVDACLDPRKQVNFSIGKPDDIDSVKREVTKNLMGIIFTEVKELAQVIETNNQANLTEEQKTEFFKQIVQTYRKNKEMNLDLETLVFSEEENAVLRGYKDTNKPLYKEITTLRAFFSEGLSTTLSRIGNVNYGRDDKHHIKTIPYKASNVPATGSEFDSEIERICFTYQDYIQNGVTFEQVAANLSARYQNAKKEIETEYKDSGTLKSFDETDAAKGFREFLSVVDPENKLQLSLSMANTESAVKEIKNLINQSVEQKIEYCARFVIPDIQTSEVQISSTSLDLPDMFNHFSGFTGTPWNRHAYHDKIHAEKTMGVDGKTWHILLNSNVSINTFTYESTNPIESLIGAEDLVENNQCLIDTGAYLRGTSNRAFIEQAVKKSGKHGIFFDERGDIVKQMDSASEAKLLSKAPETNLKENFTLYDQAHTVGADIKQAKDATAVVTVGENTFIRDLFQAVWRLRQLDQNQKVSILLSEEIKNAILNGENRDITIVDILQFCLRNEAEREADDNFRCEKEMIGGAIKRSAINTLITLLTAEDFDEEAFLETAETFNQAKNIITKTKKEEESFDRYAQSKMESEPQTILNELLKNENKKIEGIKILNPIKRSNKEVNLYRDKVTTAKDQAQTSEVQQDLDVSKETDVEKESDVATDLLIEAVSTKGEVQLNPSKNPIHPDAIHQLATFDRTDNGTINTETEYEVAPGGSLVGFENHKKFYTPLQKVAEIFDENIVFTLNYNDGLMPGSMFLPQQQEVKFSIITYHEGKWTMLIPSVHEALGPCKYFIDNVKQIKNYHEEHFSKTAVYNRDLSLHPDDNRLYMHRAKTEQFKEEDPDQTLYTEKEIKDLLHINPSKKGEILYTETIKHEDGTRTKKVATISTYLDDDLEDNSDESFYELSIRHYEKKKDPVQAVQVAITDGKPQSIFSTGTNIPFEEQEPFYRLYVQAKLLRGEVTFDSSEEQEALKKWIEDKGAEKVRKVVEEQILPHKSIAKRTRYTKTCLLYKLLHP